MNKIIFEDMQNIFNTDIDWMMFKNKSVLISGAYGMLPSYMVFMLIYLNENVKDMNINIIAMVRNKEKLISRFGEYVGKTYFKTIIADIKDEIKIDDKIDFIIHGASPASSQYYGTHPVDVILPNMLGTYNLLELAKQNKVESFLFFSSCEVYGSLPKEELLESDPGCVEQMDIRSCYAESKRIGETLCKCYSHQYGLNIKVARPAHTYGPTMDLVNDKRVFAEFVANVVNSENIVMKSDGSAERVFCYIADAVAGYFMIMLKGKSGEAYNVANKDSKISIKELAKIIAKLSPSKELKVIMEIREGNLNYLENKHKKQPLINADKLEKLGWKCRLGIVEGFSRTITSFLKYGGG